MRTPDAPPMSSETLEQIIADALKGRITDDVGSWDALDELIEELVDLAFQGVDTEPTIARIREEFARRP